MQCIQSSKSYWFQLYANLRFMACRNYTNPQSSWWIAIKIWRCQAPLIIPGNKIIQSTGNVVYLIHDAIVTDWHFRTQGSHVWIVLFMILYRQCGKHWKTLNFILKSLFFIFHWDPWESNIPTGGLFLRFKSSRLLDDRGVITCMVSNATYCDPYVHLFVCPSVPISNSLLHLNHWIEFHETFSNIQYMMLYCTSYF